MRRCQRLGCENTIDHLRVDARYCGPTCKREAARSADLSDGSASPAFWDRYGQVRRKKRCTTRQGAVAAALALAAGLVVAGCAGPQPSTTSTSTVPATSTTAPVTSSTTGPVTTPTPPQPTPLGPPAGPVVNHAVDSACGTELWAIKTLTDPGSAQVDPAAQPISTIAQLHAVSDAGAGGNTRVGIELHAYQLTGQLVEAKQEPDSDLHVILRDGTGKTVVTEYPAAQCVRDAAPAARDEMTAARKAFVTSCGQPPTSSFKPLSGTATVTGVGFYDRDHGQTARDTLGDGFDIELHPILAFTGGCK